MTVVASSILRQKVLDLHHEGLPSRRVAELVGFSRSTVTQIINSCSLECSRCEAKLLRPSYDGLCGFCQVEGKNRG